MQNEVKTNKDILSGINMEKLAVECTNSPPDPHLY